MLNNTIKIQIVERKQFNTDGQLYTKYFVYFGDDCVSSRDTFEEAEEVYYNILKRHDDPSRKVIKEAFLNQPLNFNEDV